MSGRISPVVNVIKLIKILLPKISNGKQKISLFTPVAFIGVANALGPSPRQTVFQPEQEVTRATEVVSVL